MEAQQITQILRKGEGDRVEFKESRTALPKDFYETAVSFSNTDGGIVLLGVEDDGTVCGIEPGKVKQIIADLSTTLNSPDCVSPSIYVTPIEMEWKGKTTLVIQIPASSDVHRYKGAVYMRVGDVDINITKDEKRVQELCFEKSSHFTESRIYPYLQMEDLDPALFARVRILIRNFRADHPWLLASDEQMLHESTLWRRDYRTGEAGLTLAAALIFGKDTTIQNILPAYKVEAMVRIENEDRWDDRITLRTNLIDTYLSLKAFINKHLPDKFYLEGDQRVDLRDKIFREVIGNLVVHTEYTNHHSGELIIYRNAVTVTNPNKPLFRGVVHPDNFSPYPKNPNIRKFFTCFGWTDEIGSGIRNTNKYLPIYANGAKPIFREDSIFKVEIPLVNRTLALFALQWLEWLDLPDAILPHLQKSLAQIPLSSATKEIMWEELILKMIPSWSKKATQLDSLSWPNNQVFTDSEIKKLPSWSKKATQLLKLKVNYYIIILSLCGEGCRVKEMLQILAYRDESGFKNKYLKPLREAGLITLTIPEKPTSPDNKYILTPLGKEFLAGE